MDAYKKHIIYRDETATKTETDTTPLNEYEGDGIPEPVSRDRIAVQMPSAVQPWDITGKEEVTSERLLFNRELSWLDFNWRVLYQAMDERHPLLERVKFVAITYSNLDEFFRKRVGGLRRQIVAGIRTLSPDGRTPEEQVSMIREAVLVQYKALVEVWELELKPQLASIGVHICQYDALTQEEQQEAIDYFKKNIFPVLTPLGFDPGHPFPFLSNQSLSLAVLLRHPKRGTEHFARVKVPMHKTPWLYFEASNKFVPIEEVVANNLEEVFRGMEIISVHPFRVTRNAEMSRNEDEADDLLEMIAEELRQRKFATVVRLEVGNAMPPHVRDLLLRELQLDEEDVYVASGMIDLLRCFQIASIDLPEYQFEPWDPVQIPEFNDTSLQVEAGNIFDAIRQSDVLVHHPYDSFSSSVQAFIEQAADDPSVVSIKQTLYRTSDDSPIVKALMKAAEQGKEVAVLIEVKARFDEERNVNWAKMLAENGIHVTYGLVGLKTHAKVILVIREEEEGLKTYCHIGTGNYNPSTAKIYTDIGLFTADKKTGEDLINLFNYLTAYAPEQHYQRIVVAPREMRNKFIELIHREIEHQEKSANGHIIAKMNAIDDLEIIQELYKASQAGVQIDLIIRGHTRLRPQLKGLSENIRIVSIIGRFLEHHRIFYFHHNDSPEVYIGSADWQRRNLDDRVEAMIPIFDERLSKRLAKLLQSALKDNSLAWELDANGVYQLRIPSEEEKDRNFQTRLLRRASARASGMDLPWDI